MKIEIADTCTNKNNFEASLDRIKYIINDLLKGFELRSVECIVIADTDSKKYCETIQQYAQKLNTNLAPNIDGSYDITGKCICGIDATGVFKQIIVLKSAVVNILLLDYAVLYENQTVIFSEYQRVQGIGIAITLHECGHAMDNEIMYSMFQLVKEEKGYDLSISAEQESYYLDGAISLWGEFFAESFAYTVCPELRTLVETKENELVNCIHNYFGVNITQFDRAYQILYLFAHTIAEQGKGAFDYSILEDYAEYIPFLQAIEKEFFDLLTLNDAVHNSDLSNRFSKIKIIFNRLCGL